MRPSLTTTTSGSRNRSCWAPPLAILVAACASGVPPGSRTAAPMPAGPAQAVSLTPPPAPPATPVPALPLELLRTGATFTLAQVVDIALQNNPVTRQSYLQARSAAAELGSQRAAYYPTADATANLTRSKQSALGGQFDILQTNYGGTLTLDYLLLDLGGRAADVDDARLGLLAADWAHNAAIQDVTLAVQQAFVHYLAAKAQLESAQASYATAKAALAAADGRHDAGVATISEVLLARTALSQAQLGVDAAGGDVMALRGALATAMGLPANTPYDVGELPAELPLAETTQAIEALIAQARTVRPDLAAARLQAEQAAAHIRSVRSEGMPALSANASFTRTYFEPSTYASFGDSWSGKLLLTVPLFTGFENAFDVRKAEADAGVAQATAEEIEQRVILEVWTSYYGVQTATQLINTSRDLLASAEQSQRVALERYKEGVGTIIDLLAAQAALASARAQEIQARAGWIAALAQLAHDSGVASPALQTGFAVTEEKRTP